jgi:hypothetical protein
MLVCLSNKETDYGTRRHSHFRSPAQVHLCALEQGKLVGAKPPLRPSHVWSIRTKLQIEGKKREPATTSNPAGPIAASEWVCCVFGMHGPTSLAACSWSRQSRAVHFRANFAAWNMTTGGTALVASLAAGAQPGDLDQARQNGGLGLFVLSSAWIAKQRNARLTVSYARRYSNRAHASVPRSTRRPINDMMPWPPIAPGIFQSDSHEPRSQTSSFCPAFGDGAVVGAGGDAVAQLHWAIRPSGD